RRTRCALPRTHRARAAWGSGAPDHDVAERGARAHLDALGGCRGRRVGRGELVAHLAGGRLDVEPRRRALADPDLEVADVRLDDDRAVGDLADPHVAVGGLRAEARIRPVDHDAPVRRLDAGVAAREADPGVAVGVADHGGAVELAQAHVAGADRDLRVAGRAVDGHVAGAVLHVQRAGPVEADLAEPGPHAAVAEATVGVEVGRLAGAVEVRAGRDLDRHVDR